MEYTLNILKKDIEETSFTNASDCAITRALKRAGINGQHSGFNIITISRKKVVVREDFAYHTSKVIDMYEGTTPPEDFSFKIDIDEADL